MVTVLIAGGGTGGHVFPMVAVGDAIVARHEDVEVIYVGTGRGIETRICGERGDRLELLDVLPLRGRGLSGFVKGGLRACRILPEARSMVKRIKPDVVFSVGGYAAGPITLAARSLGVPVTLLEPNAVSGLTNRLLTPLVQRAYLGFPELQSSFKKGVGRWTGVPLRRRFAPTSYISENARRILVMGGSQGAQSLNEALPRAFAALISRGVDIEVVHQTGRGKDTAVRELYGQLKVNVEIVTFIDDVADAISRADLVVGRAGAGALAELCAVGRAGLLIPYPYAADDHQRHNAQSLERDGAAICVLQADASADRLEDEIGKLLADPQRCASMAQAAAKRGRPSAAEVVADDLLELAGTMSSTGRSAGSNSQATSIEEDEFTQGKVMLI